MIKKRVFSFLSKKKRRGNNKGKRGDSLLVKTKPGEIAPVELCKAIKAPLGKLKKIQPRHFACALRLQRNMRGMNTDGGYVTRGYNIK